MFPFSFNKSKTICYPDAVTIVTAATRHQSYLTSKLSRDALSLTLLLFCTGFIAVPNYSFQLKSLREGKTRGYSVGRSQSQRRCRRRRVLSKMLKDN